MKRKSDDELEILEKLLKKEQISRNSYFGSSLSFNKAKNGSKMKKTFFPSVLRLLKYKTTEENWIEKSLAPFDARNWLLYNKDGKYVTVLRCKVFAQFREHIEGIKYFKEDWITGSTLVLVQCN